METISGILELPLEILHIVLDLLDLASIYQLGAVCRSLHRFIHQVRNYKLQYYCRSRLVSPITNEPETLHYT